MTTTIKTLITAAIVFAAVAVVAVKYWQYVTNPWTRNGQVRAQVIQITPRVSAPIVELPIKDNQFVKQGDLLFKLDPRTFRADLAEAEANLDKTRDDLRALEKQVDAARAIVTEFEASLEAAKATIQRTEAEVIRTEVDLKRAAELLERGTTSKRRFDQAKADAESALSDQQNALAVVRQAEASKLQAEADLAEALANLGAPGEENAQLRAAKADVESAELNLSFTEVRAPVDGFVTNLDLRLGSQGVANQPVLALVDVNSFWLDGFFRENVVGDIQAGDKAIVTLMTYPDQPLEGRVDSIGWGIAQEDGSTGQDLLPNISPTFEWIRLAQRVPVRVHLENVPDGVELRVGTTASVLVQSGSADQ